MRGFAMFTREAPWRNMSAIAASLAIGLALFSPVHTGQAAGSTAADGAVINGMTVHNYACMVSDPVAVPDPLPADAPPPAWVAARIQATMHPNGQTCHDISGGSPQSRQALLQQLVASQAPQAAQAVRPNIACNNHDGYSGYTDNAYNSTVPVSVHWRLNTDCTHNIYNSTFTVTAGQAWFEDTDVFAYANTVRYDTGKVNGNCTSLPYTVQFNNGGRVADPDIGGWSTTDDIAVAQFLGACQDSTLNGGFVVDTQ